MRIGDSGAAAAGARRVAGESGATAEAAGWGRREVDLEALVSRSCGCPPMVVLCLKVHRLVEGTVMAERRIHLKV